VTRVNGLVPASSREKKPPVCEACEARIVWAVTERRQRMPVNANQDITGNLVLCFEIDQLGRPTSAQLVVAAPAGYVGPRWLSHVATCPAMPPYRRRLALRGEV
jgi:hypothetical protein